MMKMKKVFVIVIAVLFYACSPTTMITGTWKSPTATKPYENILVAALTSHAVAKATIETDMVNLLSRYDIKASKSIDLFPPDISSSDSDRQRLMHKVHGKGIDAILTISILKKETESRYDNTLGPYDPYRYEYYGSFWGYYSFWYPYSYNPDYYTARIYYIETNLYNAKTEKLEWSAQSRTYDFQDLSTFSKEFAKSIVDRLAQDNIIKNVVKSKSASR